MISAIRPRLLGIVAQGKALGGVSHPGIIGRLREIFVQDMIRPFIPPTVVALTGTIVSLSGNRQHRRQDDVVLFAKDRAPLLMDLEQAVIPIEGVLAHVEVKSTLTRDDLKKAVLAAAELRDLSVGRAPAGLIFAYDSDIAAGSSEAMRLLSVLEELKLVTTSGQASSPIQMLCVAAHGTWILISKENREGWWFVGPDDAKHLLTFASVISNYAYGTLAGQGVGAYLLDPNWLQGPSPEFPLLVP
jgi:hypothetical protein